MHVPVGSIIPNHGSWISLLLLLLLPSRPDIPIHMMMTSTVLWMLVVAMLVLGVVIVVELIEGRRRRRIFCEAGLLLMGMLVRVSGKVLLGGDWREGGVVVGSGREWRLGSGEVGGFFGD